MVNNDIRKRNNNGARQSSGGDRNRPIHTLMMYNPELCNAPGKLIRLGNLFAVTPGDTKDFSGIHDGWRGDVKLDSWYDIFSTMTYLQEEIVYQINQWGD